jgi:diguanylate cyclase (GGDEF)-like protein
MTRPLTAFRVIRISVLLLCLSFAAAFLMPQASHAEENGGKTVRVGWFESSFCITDKNGNRSGYSYEYQMKIAAYNGWNYEYVNGSWPELLEMLEAGDIDLLSDVSYKPEREGHMLFSSLPMGTEEYYLFISPDNREILSTDYSTLNGKRIGVNKGSVQVGFLREWAQEQKLNLEVVEVTTSEDESLELLMNGGLDGYVTVDSFERSERAAVPVCKVGSSDFFFAVNKNRPDLLNDLDGTMSRIQDENRFYGQQLFEKYIKRVGANVFLTAEETEWLSSHGPIRVGYQDDYLAFCAKDEATGKLTGALKDVLKYAGDCFDNAHLDFEAIAYPSVTAALEALRSGEVDCVFPTNLGTSEGEQLGIVMTPPLTSTDMCAVVRQVDQRAFFDKGHIVVAVTEDNPNYDAFLNSHYPEWRKIYYPTTEDCLKAVSDNVADCVVISNFRHSSIARTCDKYRLATVDLGVEMDYSFAVSGGDMTMYSILAKAVSMIPASNVNTTMSRYATEGAKLTFTDFVMDNIGIIACLTAIVVLVILALLIRSTRSEKKASQLISATEYDALTGLYNRSFFFQYANQMFADRPETPMDAIVLDIDRFHSVNALNGREFGDRVLRTLGNEVNAVSKELHGIAGRYESDRFDIYCRHTDNYQSIFDRLQNRVNELAPNANVQLRMGVMPWQGKLEPVQMFDSARAACNMARDHYQEQLIIFNDDMRDLEMLEHRLLSNLRQALDSYDFEVHYQPKFDIQSDPPKLVGAEALVRWQHPELGIIGPKDFIPLFEKSGQVGIVDKFVWAETARTIARWRELYGVTIPVSVNLSRVDVFDPTLEKTLDDILLRNGLDNNALKLEITESAYTENAEKLIQVVEGLRSKGFEVGMDDFGSGYSSLNMLSLMPIDVLKMDSAFIKDVESDDKGVQLVALIIGIAKTLNIPVVAEGVETKEQLEILKELGCELVQGYYFSRALSSADFEATYIRDMQATR